MNLAMLRSVELNTARMSLHPTKVRDKGSAALARHTAAVITTAFGGVGLRFRLPLGGPKAGHFTHHEKHHTYSCVRDLRESETQLLTHVNAVSSRDGTKAAAEKVRHHKAQKSGGVPEGRFRLFRYSGYAIGIRGSCQATSHPASHSPASSLAVSLTRSYVTSLIMQTGELGYYNLPCIFQLPENSTAMNI